MVAWKDILMNSEQMNKWEERVVEKLPSCHQVAKIKLLERRGSEEKTGAGIEQVI